MNYHTKSIFTGHSVYWCLKVMKKNRFFKSLEIDIVSSLHALAGGVAIKNKLETNGQQCTTIYMCVCVWYLDSYQSSYAYESFESVEDS